MHLIKWVKILELNYKKLDKCYDLYIYINWNNINVRT